MANLIIALLLATAAPLSFLLLVQTLDLYGSGSRRAILFSFVWGAISVLIASTIYAAADAWLTPPFALIYLAPFLEESLKSLALVYLVRRASFTYFVDGAIYGFAVGIGFAVFENYMVIWQNVEADFGVVLGRVLSTNLMHASAGAIVGITLGLARFERFRGRLLHLLGGVGLAILLHAAFNRLVAHSSGDSLFLYAAAVGVSGLAFTVLTIRRGLAVQKAWIADTLSRSHLVTTAEISAASQIAQAPTLLQPLATLFGSKKAAQIEDLLLLQAQLGILKKTYTRARHDDHRRAALFTAIAQKQQEMEAARRAIGAYTMLTLRLLFPDAGSSLWLTLQAGGALPSEPKEQTAPANLFALIEQRSASPGESPDSVD